MKYALLAVMLGLFAMPALADDDATPEQITRIDQVLAGMTCEVDPDNIEVKADGTFDLDDVQCADGQYDIMLNADFSEKSRRKE